VASRKPKIVPAGHYYAALLDVRRRPDVAGRMVLAIQLKVSHSREADGRRLVGHLIEVELVLDADGETFERRVEAEQLAKWASWITSRGWMVLTA
jgi:hypothetical protein